ncbi:MAG TPA: molybdopterin-dependent oxidoreductase [Bryobacteraceae bacterium]|nr:molybdopterin-dependent oxidoreductase [Bryobacteraceae bacterium]
MPTGFDDRTTRRKWIVAGGALAAAAAGVELVQFRSGGAEDPLLGGKLAGALEFEDEGRAPLDTLLGDELDGRQYMDLSHLDRDQMVTPTGLFYVRTRSSHLLRAGRPWSIRLTSRAGTARITINELNDRAEPQGLRLMECAGNTRAVQFGMISVASWDGVPLARLLDQMRFDHGARILVSGFDEYAAKPVTPSVPGASWIFSRDEIESSRAFLATRMNGQPLTGDHGAPVRLVLPGWYGCACIKWVNQIESADDTAAATSQMQEYAARTHQHGMPARASEYQPATIDPAAMPVRIEKWLVRGRFRYKVVGIVWGGSRPADNLQIRFRPEEPYVPVAGAQPAADAPWALWTHIWTPRQPGIYRIRLRLADPSIRTRRMDAGFYVRQVLIDEV